MIFNVAAARVVSDNVTASLPKPVMPADPRAVETAAAVPVSVVTVAASIAPAVRPSRVFHAAAARVVSDNVTASLHRPVMPADPRAVETAAYVPVSVVTVAASIAPDVRPSRVFNAAAARVVSDNVTASLPRPVRSEEHTS